MAEIAPIVVDASVAVKWFVPRERGADRAAELLDAAARGEVRLVAPALLAHELFNVLARSAARGMDLKPALEAFFDVGVELVAPERALMTAAAELHALLGLSSYDATYAALADQLGCALATADRRLERRLGKRLPVLRI